MEKPITEEHDKEENTMINEIITNIVKELTGVLNDNQMEQLTSALQTHLAPLKDTEPPEKRKRLHCCRCSLRQSE